MPFISRPFTTTLPVATTGGLTDPWASLDGRLNAPAGTANFSTLLNTYHAVGVADGRYFWPSNASKIPVNTGNLAQPPWHVSGVDYHVGIDRTLFPTNASLTAASAVSQSGVSLDTTNHLVNITGAGVTLNGVDFSVSPGWSCNVSGNNVTIKNCNFLSSGTQSSCPINCSGNSLTVTQCEIDENFQPDTVVSGTNVCCILSSGTNITVTYCIMQNGWADAIDLQTGGTIDIHYNIFKDFGNSNSHPDLLQIEGTPGTYGPSSVTFNLVYMTPAAFGPQGFFWTQTSGITLVNLTECAYNTIINATPTQASAIGAAVVDIEMSHMSTTPAGANTARVHDNFMDPTNVATNFLFADPETSWNYPQGKVWNNTNMLNGTIDSAGPPNFSGTGP